MISSVVFVCVFFMFDKGVYFFLLDSIEPVIDDDERIYHDAGIRWTFLLDFKHYLGAL